MDNDSIKNEIKEIRKDLKQLTELVTQLLFDSQKMVNHIGFIESTYLNTNHFWLISKKV